MDPILTIVRLGEGERAIGAYALMLMAAMVVGVGYACRSAWLSKLDVGAVIATAGFTVAGAMAGSFGLYVVVEALRTGDALEAMRSGGLVFYGAPLGGGLAYLGACRLLRLPAARLLDAVVAGIPAAHALGRIGCFLAGCCYGRPWEGVGAVHYPHPLAPAFAPGVWRHPVPLYEAALLLALAAVLALWPRQQTGDGRWVGVYLMGYAFIRSTTELFRGDAERGLAFGVAATSQLISIATMAFGIWLVWRARRRSATLERA